VTLPGRPIPRRRVLLADPDIDPEASTVKFRLTYAGQLLAAGSNNRVDHKHEVRRVFHPQLRRYWNHHPFRKGWKEAERGVDPDDWPLKSSDLAVRFSRCGYRFVPLVTRDMWLSCSVEVLFLRPGWPGDIWHGGDIDNRLKIVFDALRLPSDANELGKHTTPVDDEDPFFCLLEDDSLVSHVSFETDVLLEALTDYIQKSDARLVITVTVVPAAVTMLNQTFGGR